MGKCRDFCHPSESFSTESSMNYSELIQKLLQVNVSSGMKLELQNVQSLQQLLGFPDRAFKIIHVAGTNGKGSVCTKIASVLEHAGYRVGLYTSPHLSCFRERIRINGMMIPEDAVKSILSTLFHIVEKEHIPATFFELTTFLAFLYFAKENADVAVLETGLGGRLDATNIVHPILSVITSISLDHVEILGSTREAITLEKAGIIKEKVPVIIGPHVPYDIIQKIAQEKESLCTQVKCHSTLFEEENNQIALTAINELAHLFHLNSHAIEIGLKAKQPCRFERVAGNPSIILDVAHNPNGIQHLFHMLNHAYPNQPIRLLFGLSKNKDLKECIKLIANQGKHFHLIEATNGRGAPIQDLYDQLLEFKVNPADVFTHHSILNAVQQAKEEASKFGEVLVICGSFFIMSQVRQALGIEEPCDAMDLNERHSRYPLFPQNRPLGSYPN